MSALSISHLTAAAIARGVKTRALEIGFDLVGIASAEPSRYRAFLRQWLDDGRAGSMAYLEKRFDERTDLAAYMPGAASAICVALNYHAPLVDVPADVSDRHGKIARYALGDDYHDLIKSRLFALADWIRRVVPEAQTRCGVDTAPILERELAARAGIGWIGKNTCIIHPRVGSWILLGEVITNVPLPADEAVEDHCGVCTRCIDACPTGAITAPYQIDARRCISYLTIEHRELVAREIKPLIGNWLYGCDICQDVCPHNRHAPAAIAPGLRPRFATGGLDVQEVADWTEETYRQTLRKSAIKRVKLPILQRNAETVANNRGKPALAGPQMTENDESTR